MNYLITQVWKTRKSAYQHINKYVSLISTNRVLGICLLYITKISSSLRMSLSGCTYGHIKSAMGFYIIQSRETALFSTCLTFFKYFRAALLPISCSSIRKSLKSSAKAYVILSRYISRSLPSGWLLK